MKLLPFILIFLISIHAPTQEPKTDRLLGMGLVELSMDREESATQFFMGSSSNNAMAILERIQNPKGLHRYKFDYNDITFHSFYSYLKYTSKKPKYYFLAEVVRQVDARNPNKELGSLGLFYNAYFSPKSTYLIIYTTDQTILLESKSGKTMEVITRSYEPNCCADLFFIFSKDELFILKYKEINNTRYGETHKKIVSYENYHTKKVIWKKEFINRVEASFSKDYSKVIIFNYEANGYTNCDIIYIDKATGKVLSKKTMTHVAFSNAVPLFRKYAALYVDYFPEFHSDNVKIESGNKRYVLTGNKTYGNFTLKRAKDSKEIRMFRFGSAIE